MVSETASNVCVLLVIALKCSSLFSSALSVLFVKERQARLECPQGKHIAVLTALERWLCMLLSQTGNTKNMCIPTRLDNAGKEESTF